MNNPISPQFLKFLAHGEDGAIREAIVLFRPSGRVGQAALPHLPRRRRLQEIDRRLAAVSGGNSSQNAEGQAALAGYLSGVGDRGLAPRRLRGASLSGAGVVALKLEATPASLRMLSENPDVLAIMPNDAFNLVRPCRIEPAALSAEERSAGRLWSHQVLDIGTLGASAGRGAGVTVGVLDTGVHGDHPALAGRVGAFAVVDPLGRRLAMAEGATFDVDTHGTHVCGIIAGGTTPEGVPIGIAPDARLVVAAVLVGPVRLAAIVQGALWAVENGAEILNFSFGQQAFDPKLADFMEILLTDLDVLPVVAIGNDCLGTTCSPGNACHALGVGAVDQDPSGDLHVADFSSGGSFSYPSGRPAKVVTKPDLVAPGSNIYSCIPPGSIKSDPQAFAYMDGTSMAAPQVSGIAAVLMSAVPLAPAIRILEALKETARHPDGPDLRPDNRWGHGVIDPAAALAALKA